MKRMQYISPIFPAREFKNIAQIEAEYRFLEPIREVPIPKGSFVKRTPENTFVINP